MGKTFYMFSTDPVVRRRLQQAPRAAQRLSAGRAHSVAARLRPLAHASTPKRLPRPREGWSPMEKGLKRCRMSRIAWR